MPDTEPTTDILPLCTRYAPPIPVSLPLLLRHRLTPGWGSNGPAPSARAWLTRSGRNASLKAQRSSPVPVYQAKEPGVKTNACVRLKGMEKSKRKKRGALRIFSVCFKVILPFPAFFQFFSMHQAQPPPLSLRLLQAPSHNHSAGKLLLRAPARPPLSYI